MNGVSSVSVIIPAYRAAGTIRRAVDSVLAQTVPPSEIVVIDDGSPDDIAAAVAGYADRVNYIRQSNGGASSARNFGLDCARGTIVAFLDADDYWEPNKLAEQLAVLARHPEVGIVAARYYGQDVNENAPRQEFVLSRFEGHVMRLTGEQAFTAATLFFTSTVMVRRELAADIRFDTRLPTAEDSDCWFRMILAAPSYVVPKALATAVLELGSLSRTLPDRAYGNMLSVVERYRGALGRGGYRRWRARVYQKWAAEYLSAGQPAAALPRAIKRLGLQPMSRQAWWIAAKASWLTWRNAGAGADSTDRNSLQDLNTAATPSIGPGQGGRDPGVRWSSLLAHTQKNDR